MDTSELLAQKRFTAIYGCPQPGATGAQGLAGTATNTVDLLPIVPYIISLNSGDSVAFVSQVDGSNTVQALAVTTSIVGPGIPSIIVGIKQIG